MEKDYFNMLEEIIELVHFQNNQAAYFKCLWVIVFERGTKTENGIIILNSKRLSIEKELYVFVS